MKTSGTTRLGTVVGNRQDERRNAIVTASYAPDFDRCALLCDSIDRHVTGFEAHYILVASRDVCLFRQLEGARRKVIDERDVLPGWLRVFPDPFRFGRRPVWLSMHTMPLHGWQVQQLRQIALADHIDEQAIMHCDSDTAFVRAYDLGSAWSGDRLRLYRKENGLAEAEDDHEQWVQAAGRVFGLPREALNGHDYVSTHIHWRADVTRAMCRHVERVTGRHWLAAIGRTRKFSECMFYGHFVDDVCGGDGHYHDGQPLCRIHWFAPPPDTVELADWIASTPEEQIAVGIQSYIPIDTGAFRKALGL